ncbi:MAG: hypothetical protein NZZ41_02390 [Candidatus Dojkabacteria bacterium]|nr:hypothetical protein [Candidatus Dojkabacteria bacterium]
MFKLKIILVLLVQIFLLTSALFPLSIQISAETLQEKLERLEREIKEIKNKRAEVENQIGNLNRSLSGFDLQLSKLNAEISLYENFIAELQAAIDKLEIEIKINEEKISRLQREILETENSISEIEHETNKRILESYVNYRIYGNFEGADYILSLDDVNNYFKKNLYKEILQFHTNQLLSKINLLRTQLIQKKKELDNIQTENTKRKTLLAVQTADLLHKKQESSIKQAQILQEIYNIRIQQNIKNAALREITEYQRRKQAEAELIRQQIINNFVPKDPGTYVLAGTYIAKQGSTGFSTGAHLHFEVVINNVRQNPCNYLKPGPAGCGVQNGILQWPVKDYPISFTSPYGPRCFSFNGSPYCDFHTGIDVVATPWNAPVYAAHDGFVHKGVDQYGGKYIILCERADCSGMKTAYWHLSEF